MTWEEMVEARTLERSMPAVKECIDLEMPEKKVTAKGQSRSKKTP